MAIIGGWLDLQQGLDAPTVFGINIWFLGICAAFIGNAAIIGQLYWKIREYQNHSVEFDVYPRNEHGLGISIDLMVHNKTQFPANVSATLSCVFDMDGVFSNLKQSDLMEVPMVWEATGKHVEEIGADTTKALKLCESYKSQPAGVPLREIKFFKAKFGKVVGVSSIKHGAEQQKLKAKIKIGLDANLPIKGNRDWYYQLEYVPNNAMLVITKEINPCWKSTLGTQGSEKQ